MDGSKRSTKANAFFTGFGANKRIALYDTLLADNENPEIVAVLAHEIGHYKLRHVIHMMIFSLVHLAFLFFLFSLFLNNERLFSAFFMEKTSVYGSLVFFGLLYAPVSLVFSVLLNAVSRRNEFAADHYAVKTFAQPLMLASALKKLSVKNLSNLTPHSLYVFLHYSHPPLMDRVDRIVADAGKGSSLCGGPAGRRAAIWRGACGADRT